MTQNPVNSRESDGKVIGIGLSKTGTSSLVRALQILGLDAVHFPSDSQTLHELRRGHYSLSVLKKHQAIAEGIAPFFPQLDTYFPNSKFILTIRDLESWLDSAEHHWPFVEEWARHNQEFNAAWDFLSTSTFGVRSFQRERFTYVYLTHLDRVRRYFAARSHVLLELDICGGDGWEKLCPFLGLPEPDSRFPLANRRESKQDRRVWVAKLDTFTERLHALAVEENKRPFVLVDDHRLHGSAVYHKFGAVPFRRQDQEYLGPPSDGDDAWSELMRHRQQGARMVVFCWDSFWWFDHYSRFTDRIRSRYVCVADDDVMRAFDLTASR